MRFITIFILKIVFLSSANFAQAEEEYKEIINKVWNNPLYQKKMQGKKWIEYLEERQKECVNGIKNLEKQILECQNKRKASLENSSSENPNTEDLNKEIKRLENEGENVENVNKESKRLEREEQKLKQDLQRFFRGNEYKEKQRKLLDQKNVLRDKIRQLDKDSNAKLQIRSEGKLRNLKEELKNIEEQLTETKKADKDTDNNKNSNIPEPYADRKSWSKRDSEQKEIPYNNIRFKGIGSDSFWVSMLYILGIGLAIGVIVYILSWISKSNFNEKNAIKPEPKVSSVLEKVKDDVPLDLEALCIEGRYIDACRVLFKDTISLLNLHGKLPNKPFLTNHEFLCLLQDESTRNDVKILCDIIERGYYACRSLTYEDFKTCQETLDRMKISLSRAR